MKKGINEDSQNNNKSLSIKQDFILSFSDSTYSKTQKKEILKSIKEEMSKIMNQNAQVEKKVNKEKQEKEIIKGKKSIYFFSSMYYKKKYNNKYKYKYKKRKRNNKSFK